jgi:hypothetical protein
MIKALAVLLVAGILWLAWELYRAPLIDNDDAVEEDK